ncbi:MAG: glucosamine 6-phosphate synthetase [Promethearchaeota archaeon CR_4]|nr:MAG: glucosamine 6-phosphate synthetase [Candidatus Lokiarchaeota archaeon CR_4]
MSGEKNHERGELTLAEIWEIPSSLKRTLHFREKIRKIAQVIVDKNPLNLILAGNGTSFHAGFASQYNLISIAKIQTVAILSPEFHYQIQPILDVRSIVIVISQSGESEDSLMVCEAARAVGAMTIGITNNETSRLAKNTDLHFVTMCGPEKSVLATKTYVSQLGMLFALTLEIGFLKHTLREDNYNDYWKQLELIPDKIESLLPDLRNAIRKISRYYKFAEKAFVIGTGPDFATAQEAALKLKEGARIFAQAYSTSEFPHGPITLADHTSWIIAIIPHEKDERRQKMLRLLSRLKEREATILGICSQMTPTNELDVLDHVINLPNVPKIFNPLIAIIPLQILSVEIAIIKNINPDTPKYLTKISQI